MEHPDGADFMARDHAEITAAASAWSLDPGVLAGIIPAQPTGFGVRSQWRCVNVADPAAHHSGGKSIQAWYEQLSAP